VSRRPESSLLLHQLSPKWGLTIHMRYNGVHAAICEKTVSRDLEEAIIPPKLAEHKIPVLVGITWRPCSFLRVDR